MLALVLASALALAVLGLAPAARAAVVNPGSGPPLGLQALAPATSTATGTPVLLQDPLDGTNQGVTYHGGPVLHGTTTYAIYWDPAGAFAASTESVVSGFLANVAHDSGSNDDVFSVAAQYTDTTGSASYQQTYGGSFVDSDPYPASGGCAHAIPTAPTCLNNSQVATELTSFVASHGLPTGMGALYVLLTPDTVVTCIDGGGQCSNNSYCSFHSFASDANSTLLYIEIPFTLLNDASNAKSCQSDGDGVVQEPNGDPGFGDVALKSLSHEMLETITDPLLNAWFDSDGNEVADLCNGVSWNPDSFLPAEGGTAAAGTLWNQTINGAHYYLQGSWSNATNGCALTAAVAPSFVAPAASVAGTALSFDANGGTNVPVTSYAWSFGDGTTAQGQSATHTYAAAGDYNVTLTVTDSLGATGSITEQVDATSAGGKTAGASGTSRKHSKKSKHPKQSKHASTTRCSKIHHSRGGRETRHCTKSVAWLPSSSDKGNCSHKSGKACQTSVPAVIRVEACTEVRKSAASAEWSMRCTPPLLLSKAGAPDLPPRAARA